MDKPISIIIEDARQMIADAINKTGLPPCILEMIIKEYYQEIHHLAEHELIDAKEDGNADKQE